MGIKASCALHNSQIPCEISLRRLKFSARQLRLYVSPPFCVDEELCNSSEESHD